MYHVRVSNLVVTHLYYIWELMTFWCPFSLPKITLIKLLIAFSHFFKEKGKKKIPTSTKQLHLTSALVKIKNRTILFEGLLN